MSSIFHPDYLERKALISRFSSLFDKDKDIYVFSAPGRTEIGGNHTDHQHGKVLAAAVNLEAKAAVARNKDDIIRIKSEGYDYFEINLSNLSPVSAETGTTASLVRGIASKIRALGHSVTGFDAYVVSNVFPGGGLSSSAAFEVLIGTIINELNNCRLSAIEIAQIGQYAENVYYGKPCGLMDQMASSVGNMITIDFENNDRPVVKSVNADFAAFGYSLCIIDSGADHSDLTDEYAAIPRELKKLCGLYGKNFLREIPEEEFYLGISNARQLVGDRTVLRAIHIYDENERVDGEVKALENGDFGSFLELVNASGKSSWLLLQNITPAGRTTHQELAFALTACEKLLCGRGACRVHGGGFAGTIQAFVPNDMLEDFKVNIEKILGSDSCHILNIRKSGGILEEYI